MARCYSMMILATSAKKHLKTKFCFTGQNVLLKFFTRLFPKYICKSSKKLSLFSEELLLVIRNNNNKKSQIAFTLFSGTKILFQFLMSFWLLL